MPILRSLGPTAKPGSSRCTTNAEMPLAPFSGSVTAMTVYHSEMPALVIQALVPLSTQVSPSQPGAGLHRRGVGAGLPLGEPVADHRRRRRRSTGSTCCFTSSSPDRMIGIEPSLLTAGISEALHVDPGDLLDHDAGRDRVGALAAVGLGDVRGVEAGRGQRLLRLDREARVGVHLGGERRDLPLGDVPDRLPDRLVLVGQGVQPGSVVTHG